MHGLDEVRDPQAPARRLQRLRRFGLPMVVGIPGLLLLLFTNPRAPGQEDQARDPRKADREAILAVLGAQAQAWNAGDVDQFMVGYWNSPDLTFASGGEVTRGWQQTLERYRAKYPDRKAMGRVAFSEMEVRFLGADAALVLGRWSLEREQPVGGVFSLIFRRIEAHWVIVHDHTSSATP